MRIANLYEYYKSVCHCGEVQRSNLFLQIANLYECYESVWVSVRAEPGTWEPDHDHKKISTIVIFTSTHSSATTIDFINSTDCHSFFVLK